MERLLIFIKHHLRIVWRIIEWSNGIIFSILYRSRMESVLCGVFKEVSSTPVSCRRLNSSDLLYLHELLTTQSDDDLKYFNPHDFDMTSLESQLRNKSFLMMGAFDGYRLVGYFFLRFFSNKKCFVGRLISNNYRGKGIGKVMNKIMYETAWLMGFRCLSTISKNNTSVIKSHSRNRNMVVLKELDNDYILVEFVRR